MTHVVDALDTAHVQATLGHIVTGTVARNLVRRSHRPVVVVPEFGDGPR